MEGAWRGGCNLTLMLTFGRVRFSTAAMTCVQAGQLLSPSLPGTNIVRWSMFLHSRSVWRLCQTGVIFVILIIFIKSRALFGQDYKMEFRF